MTRAARSFHSVTCSRESVGNVDWKSENDDSFPGGAMVIRQTAMRASSAYRARRDLKKSQNVLCRYETLSNGVGRTEDVLISLFARDDVAEKWP